MNTDMNTNANMNIKDPRVVEPPNANSYHKDKIKNNEESENEQKPHDTIITEDSVLVPLTFENKEVSSLIHKMVSLGYFHTKEGKSKNSENGNGDNKSSTSSTTTRRIDPSAADEKEEQDEEITIDSMKQYQAELISKKQFQSDQGCNVLFPTYSSSLPPPSSSSLTLNGENDDIQNDTSHNKVDNDNDNHNDNHNDSDESSNSYSTNIQKEGEKETFCMTRSHVTKQIYSLLIQNNGRLSLSTICKQMNLPWLDVERATREVTKLYSNPNENENGDENQNNGNGNDTQNGRIHYIVKQKELINDAFMDGIFQTRILNCLHEKGIVSVSDLAMTYFHLPLDFMLNMIEERLVTTSASDVKSSSNVEDNGWRFEPDVKLIIGNDGVKNVVTSKYEQMRCEEVKNMLMNVDEPIRLKDIIDTIDWDPNEIFNQIKLLCKSNEIQGEIHTDSSSSSSNNNKVILSGAIYIPFVYEENQKNTVDNLFSTNGYITIHQAKQIGISNKKLEQYIVHDDNVKGDEEDDNNHDNAIIVLKECIIHNDIILNPVQAAIVECIEVESFVDLSIHIPNDILCCKDDVQTILMDYVLDKMKAKGCLVIQNDEVLYFSEGMIKNISSKILPPLIEEYAKTRAMEVVNIIDEKKKNSQNSTNTSGGGVGAMKEVKKSKKSQGKMKSRSKHTKKKTSSEENNGNDLETPNIDLISLETTATAISNAYSDLVDIQECYKNDLSFEPKWQDVDDDQRQAENEGPLYKFCRLALNNDSKLENDCSKAVEVEVEKIMKTRRGSSMSKRGQGAVKSRNIEELFEAHFPTACYFVQLTAKLSLSLTSDPEITEEDMDILTDDLLHHCACFAQRITEYCLFKTGLDVYDIFHFSKDDGDDDEGFYSAMDLAQCHFPNVFLSCTSQDSDTPQDPLKSLRGTMPGNIGVGLARMWVYSGGDHYDGGRRVGDDGSSFVRPGNVEKFRTHVEEFCLSMVGIPFKLLDKKSEKKLMFARRKELTLQLQDATESKQILELAIILLFQQIRGIVVFGEEVTGIIFKQLMCEKKIPSNVKSSFQHVSLLLQNGEEIPEKLLTIIKGCGLSKDISSYEYIEPE